jgi:hypothetical protein
MRFSAITAALLLAFGCSPASKSDCNDGRDNDGDGLIDDADPGCAYNDGDSEYPNPPEPPAKACANDSDDDGDGLTDYPDDPGCASADDDDETDPPPPPPQCNDGIDNDGDGRYDYPYDAGCESLEDDDEVNPDPLPACGDGIDNDANGMTDYPGDPGCTAASDDEEWSAAPAQCGPSITVQAYPTSGVAEGDRAAAAPNELVGNCGGQGAELVWTYTVPASRALVVSTDDPATTLDTVIYVRSVCRNPSSELGCDDDVSPADKASLLVVPRVEPGMYYIVVDSFGPASLGHVKLTVTTAIAQGDPCSVGGEACAPGMTCRALTEGAATTCQPPVCSDGADEDGDGDTDYPYDPGCTSAEDGDETDPDPLPECHNGVDDDSDGHTDFPDDPGCRDAAGDQEYEGVPAYPFIIGDGVVDDYTHLIAGGTSSTMFLYAAVYESVLYVATNNTGAGSDHFIFVSAAPPSPETLVQPAPWGKLGTVGFPADALVLAAENDSSFGAWLVLGTGVGLEDSTWDYRSDLNLGRSGYVMEGIVDLASLFGTVPPTVYLAVAPYVTSDGGHIWSSAQMPATINSDNNIDYPGEVAAVNLADIVVGP